MTTVVSLLSAGYGDIHGVNVREMIFIMVYASFNMILAAYLLGNMTALIVKGTATEKFRDKMASMIKFMDRHQLPHNIRKEMKSHVVLQFETGTHAEDEVIGALPSSIRSKVAHSLYSHIVHRVQIFRGCSSEFLDEIVSRVIEEHFLPGEVVIHQGGPPDQFYIVCHGVLEEILVQEDGKLEMIERHEAQSIFGEVGVLCNIPQPFSVRVSELCRLLRLDKHSFTDLVQIYFNDGRLLINNLLEWKDTDARIGQIAADVTFLVAKQAAELALMVNNASFQGDLVQLKHLVKQGAIVARADYDGRTALHLAASRGFDSVVLYLIREGADINSIDKFGITPLLEAVKAGHDHCMSVLVEQGAHLHLRDSGSYLCQAVSNNNNELLRRLLLVGADPSSADYDRRTALHIAAAEGNLALATMMIDAGADISAKDRWGRTALDEAVLRDHGPLIPLLTEATNKRKIVRPRHRRLTAEHHEFESRIHEREKVADKSSGYHGGGGGGGLGAQSSHSGDSSGGSARKRVQSSFMHRQTSTESRRAAEQRGSTHASIGPSSRPSVDFENAIRHYRMLPIRRKGRPSHMASFSDHPTATMRSRRRVTMFPFHPFTPSSARTGGRVDWVPPNIQEVLHQAYLHFGKEGTKVLNHDAGEIPSTDLIMDSEKVFVVNDDDLQVYRSFSGSPR